MKHLIAVASVIALSACANEAGTLDNVGDFGNSTMQNTMIHSGEASFVTDLSNRFASEVPTTINFDFNSSQLDATAQNTLRQQAQWIKQFPEVRFKVFGHTDAVGSSGVNKALGMARARSAVNFLVGQGIGRDRLEAVVSFGETQPLIVTDGRERRNRRTVTEVTGFVQSHPAIMDGRYAEVVFRETVRSAEPRSQLIRIEQVDSVVQSTE